MSALLAGLRDPERESGGTLKGVAIGVVSDNKDPLGLGRVKVRLPWRESNDESDWLRMVSPMAGSGRGLLLVPKVGDEVLVIGEREEVDHLYGLGVLWNGKDKPPAGADRPDHVHRLRTPDGHQVTLEDGASPQVEVLHKDGAKALLTRDAVEIDIGGNKIVLKRSGDVEVTALAKVSIKAPQIDVEAQAALNLKSNGVVTISGTVVRIN